MLGSLLLFSFIGCCLGLIPFNLGGKTEAPSAAAESLPNLLRVQDFSELSNHWETKGHILLDTGRFLYNIPWGALWSLQPLPRSSEEWTVELMFRSSGKASEDVAYSEKNGLSFWLVDKASKESDSNNFGGPSKFDGFQFLINAHETKGIKVFANDGNQQLRNTIADSIGECTFDYLDSEDPFSVRLSYSRAKNWFKIQIDNNVCFKTDKIQIPSNAENLQFGASALIHPSSKEFFEVFRLSIWDHLTEDAIDDHGLLTDGILKSGLKTIVKKDPNGQQPPARESLMERQRKMKELELQNQIANGGNNDVLNKLAEVEKLLKTPNEGEYYDYSSLEAQLKEIKEAQNDFIRHINNLMSTVNEQYSGISLSIKDVNERIIGEVREHQYGIEEVGKKVDLLMRNHKEIAHQYQELNVPDDKPSSVGDVIVKWILIPILIGVLILIVFIYRLRKDIKHSKLL